MSSQKSQGLSRRSMLRASAVAATFAALGSNFAHAAGNDTIKIGLVGCGGRGRGAAIDALKSPGTKLIALGDLFADKASDAKKAFEEKDNKEQYEIGGRCFAGWDACQQVLATDINYVVLATPPGFRPAQIDLAIKAGKHIFAEKPVAVDAPGCRQIMEAGKLATEKKLGLVAGTQRRHDRLYMETVKRIQEGAIGKVLGGQVYWVGGELGALPKKEGWSDLEWQIRNWQYFCWLSGDIIVEQHVHNIDIANWVIGKTPRLALSLGGRQTRLPVLHGHTYDHFATDFEYPDGQHVLSMCRQSNGCYSPPPREQFYGETGVALVSGGSIKPYDKSKDGWKRKTEGNPYEFEHADLIKSIRDGNPINECQTIADSVLTAIMGRMSAYTGQIVTWQAALNSKESLMPAKMDYSIPLPIPEVPVPGKTKLG